MLKWGIEYATSYCLWARLANGINELCWFNIAYEPKGNVRSEHFVKFITQTLFQRKYFFQDRTLFKFQKKNKQTNIYWICELFWEIMNIFWICEQILWKRTNFEFPKHFSKTWTFSEFVNNFLKHEHFSKFENKFWNREQFRKSRTNLEAQTFLNTWTNIWNPNIFWNLWTNFVKHEHF